EVDTFHQTNGVNIRVVNQVGRIERVSLLTGDKRKSWSRGPAHERPSNVDAVQIVSACDRGILRVSRTVITRGEHDASEETALELEGRRQAQAETPAVTRNDAVLRTKQWICQDHRYPLIPLVAYAEIAANPHFLHPIPNLDLGRGRCDRFFGGFGADLISLFLGKDAFSHKSIKQRLITFRLRVRSHIRRRQDSSKRQRRQCTFNHYFYSLVFRLRPTGRR